ncbi:golgin subfamily A member 2-like [Watersipora subatra]|uniref:golgin subfamily A member 2-like n=1 Tax=Watersipora subatra TaxID=2589382 RepID=UPI00355C8AF3
MESSKERDAKLASARKKLKKFKTQKGSKPSDHSAANGLPVDLLDNGLTPADSSAVESLLQLSNQLNGLLEDSADLDRVVTNGSAGYGATVNGDSPKGRRSPIGRTASSEETLMQRNRDLADKVKQLQQKNTQLTRQMQIQAEHLSELERQLNTSESEATEKSKLELSHTKEQLQVHIQTIGILVEEKQTLQKQLSVTQKHSQQKSDELEDITSRLKASRLRVADLEKQLAVSNTQRARAETASGDNSKQLEKLKHDVHTKSRDLEEVLEQRNQLEKQLQSRVAANADLEATITDLRSKLELSDAYIQQLNNGETPSTRPDLYAQQIEELKTQNVQLHENVSQLEDSLQKALSDRNQTIDQYNHIITSLQSQQEQVHSQYESSQGEVAALEQRLREFHSENTKLQKQIEEYQVSDTTDSPPAAPEVAQVEQAPPTYTEEQVQQVLQQYELLRQQCEAYAKNCDVLSSDNHQLSRLLEEKEEAVSELESTMERIQDEKDNSKKLLETVEGDKSALSRALSQNRQLKSQLEELETRFVKMTEDNMERLTSLQREEHINKELSVRLEEVEAQLESASSELSQSKSYISEHETQLEQVTKMAHQQEQLADRIRHYEAQIQVMSALQRELHSSQETVRALTAQNSELREMIVQKSSVSRQVSVDHSQSTDTDSMQQTSASSTTESTDLSDTIQQLTMTIQQLEAERVQLQRRCEETIGENTRLSHELLSQTEPVAGDRVTRQQYEALKDSLDALQDKYTLVMKSKAEILDRSEILEYENMQLEAESETINEYISLYHHQRALMKTRAEEKDRYIQQLAEEREKVGVKLGELQGLVFRLLQERQLLQSYTADSTQRPVVDSKSEEWPDYESDSEVSHSDAMTSQSQHSLSGHEAVMDTSLPNQQSASPLPALDLSKDFVERGERVPGVTAQRIMTLLSEIGHNNKIERDPTISHILHCSHCSGPVVTM